MIQRLCLISREYPPDTAWGGIARAVELEARALASIGIETHVITHAPRGNNTTHMQDGVNVHRVAEPTEPSLPDDMHYARIGLWSRTVADKYWELDSAVGFDSIEAADYYAETLHLYRRDETPLAIWLHTLMAIVWDSIGAPLTGNERGWAALEIAALRGADMLIGPTELIINETHRHLGEISPPTTLVPYVFDPGRFSAPDAVPRSPGAPLRLLFLGRLEPRKGVDLAVHTLAAARRAGIEASLTVVGRDDLDYRWELDQVCEELEIPDVEFLPPVDESGVLAHLAAADCALLPSRFENSSLAALEALSCGVPVIAGERNGLGSWFSAETGLVRLPTDDPKVFGRRAAEVLGDPGWLGDAGPAAARHVRSVFDPAATAARLVELHEQLVASRRGGRLAHG